MHGNHLALPTRLRRSYHTIVFVIIQVDEKELKKLVTDPATDYFFVNDFAGLQTIINSTTTRICESFTLPPGSPGNTTTGM